MRKVLLVAWREYRATVATKAFVIGLALMPILFGGGGLLQLVLRDRVNLDDKHIVVVDHTGKLFQPLVAAAKERNETPPGPPATTGKKQSKYVIEPPPEIPLTEQQRLELSDRIRRGDLYAFVELPVGILEMPTGNPPARPTFYSLSRLINEPQNWLEQQLTQLAHEHRFQQTGIDRSLVQQIMVPISLDAREPYKRTESGGIQEAKAQSEGEAVIVPVAIMMLMSLAIFGTSQSLLQCVLEEKQLRISEVLLGSVNASHLMAGKLLGNIGASLTMVLTYVAGAVALAAYHDKLHLVSPRIVVWFMIYQVLAVMLFGALFLAIGAACSNAAETQNLLLPVILIAIFPMFIWFLVLQDPLGRFSLGMSLIPTATPMLMMMRMAVAPSLPFWQPLLGLVLMILTTTLFTFLAGRVFRIGILSRGKAPSFRELVRWAASG